MNAMNQNNTGLTYMLKNFQMSFFGATLKEAVQNVKSKLYWIGLTEESRLSYAMLQCQLEGRVDSARLDELLARPVNVAVEFDSRAGDAAQPSCITNAHLKQLNEWNRDELRFYSLVTSLFWQRVRQHQRCLIDAGELDETLLI